jgi:SAM-dependent methyltransferase
MDRCCPVCAAGVGDAQEFLEDTIDSAKISEFSFASRKVPEYMNHRMVRCRKCDVVYVCTPPPAQELANAYHVANYDSSEEADDAAAAYIGAIAPVLARLARRGSALEVGTGTGAFLESLSAKGFGTASGVEPSTAAIAAAPAHRRPWIREGVFDERDFEPESFDLVCCFMTMEHVSDPKQVAESARRLLRPGGAFVTVTHDYRSVVNRILGKRSPIIDIEHMQLFSRRSIGRLFEEAGYVNIHASAFANRYSLSYWLRLFPMPIGVKGAAQKALRSVRLDRVKLAVNVGNVIAWGFK